MFGLLWIYEQNGPRLLIVVERWPVSSQSRDKTQVLALQMSAMGRTHEAGSKEKSVLLMNRWRQEQPAELHPAGVIVGGLKRKWGNGAEEPQLKTIASVRVGPDLNTASLLLIVKTGSSNLQLTLYWLAVDLSDVISSFFFCSFVSLGIYRQPLTCPTDPHQRPLVD